MTFSSDDGARVTVATAWSPAGSSDDGSSELRHVSFFPWSDWPGDGSVEPSLVAHPEGGASFAVAHSTGDRAAVAFAEPIIPGKLWFSHDLIPDIGLAEPAKAMDTLIRRLMFALDGPSMFLIGYESDYDMYARVKLYDPTTDDDFTISPGCASNGVTADAVRFKDGWLVAISNSVPDPHWACSTAGTKLGPASMIQTMYLSENMIESIIGESYETGVTIGHIAMAPRPGGAWLVFTEDEQPHAPLRLAQMSGIGELDLFPGATSATVSVSSAFDIWDLGGRLAIAWVENPAKGIDVSVISVNAPGSAQHMLSAVGPVSSAPTLLANREGDRLLVAWSEEWPEGERVRVAQLECRTEAQGAP